MQKKPCLCARKFCIYSDYQKDFFFFYFSSSGFSAYLKMPKLQKLYLFMRGAAAAVQASVFEHHSLPSFSGAAFRRKWSLFLVLLFAPGLAPLTTRIMRVSANRHNGFQGLP